MKQYFILAIALAIVGSLVLIFWPKLENGEGKVAGPALYISEKEFDFGIVKQSGGTVSHDFVVRNIGSEKATIDSLPGSCACTSAKSDKKEILPGESATVTVIFDPNMHEEPKGKFFKTVEVIGNVVPHPEFKVYAEVNVDLGAKFYKLQTKDND
ncbi:MAG: DUF1573 domain-containing protein [Candidatus Niyogibacteria bacterium]|nr:DUF1573 domain-containing protein [Candidatus Niyogibacteria bacterium]